VYDGQAWRLPPIGASSFLPVDSSGAIDKSVNPNATAEFHVEGLEGTVLPTPTRAVAFQATNAPALVTDGRTGTIRVEAGQVKKGFVYSIAFGVLPKEAALLGAPPAPAAMKDFLEAPPPPAAVRNLIASAPKD